MRVDLAVKDKLNISRQKAQALISDGKVSLNGKIVLKPSVEALDTDVIEVEQSDVLKYVGRGGLKLEKALNEFNISVRELKCIDIGSSTGGFTDCLLRNGAACVYAVDVGTGQLAEMLKEDNRVISLENTDIRAADLPIVDFICADVSFISLTKILFRVSELLKDGGGAVLLIKPQFEAGKQYLNKKGIVKDVRMHKRVIGNIFDACREADLGVQALTTSPIKGGDGNTEYLIYVVKGEIDRVTEVSL